MMLAVFFGGLIIGILVGIWSWLLITSKIIRNAIKNNDEDELMCELVDAGLTMMNKEKEDMGL